MAFLENDFCFGLSKVLSLCAGISILPVPNKKVVGMYKGELLVFSLLFVYLFQSLYVMIKLGKSKKKLAVTSFSNILQKYQEDVYQPLFPFLNIYFISDSFN
jgi:hypothetical protein